MVIVNCDRGYNVGFIDRQVDEIPASDPEEPLKPKKVLNQIKDEDQTIRNMLRSKISAENYALTQCKSHARGRRLAIFSDIIATEFQFDRKKLMVYIKKYEDVSVCRLVRKLYETFKMRIKVYEVEDPQVLYEMALKYHELAKLNLPFSDIFNFDPRSNSVPFLNPQVYQGRSRHSGQNRKHTSSNLSFQIGHEHHYQYSEGHHTNPNYYRSNYQYSQPSFALSEINEYRRPNVPSGYYSHDRGTALDNSHSQSRNISHDTLRDWSIEGQQGYYAYNDEWCDPSFYEHTGSIHSSFPAEDLHFSPPESDSPSQSNLWTQPSSYPPYFS